MHCREVVECPNISEIISYTYMDLFIFKISSILQNPGGVANSVILLPKGMYIKKLLLIFLSSASLPTDNRKFQAI